MLSLGVSLQPRWPIDDETAALRAASHAEDLDFDHVAVGNRLLDSGFGLDADPRRAALEEYDAVGVPARERGARTDDHLAAAKALWAQRPTDFDGPFTTLRAARLGVPPVTPGGPPVWVGGHSDAALIRALRFGDGWYGTGVTAAAGLTACTAWLPIAAEHVEKAMDWIAAEVIPHLT